MYQVTATRRRPQTFDELLGQDFVSATLKKSIEAGKIANAYLFSGPRGCGKTSTARILAKAINCIDGPTAHPCGVCDSCIQITNGSSFDVIEIDGASNTSVDDVRKLKDEILFPPAQSKYKVYIIDEVHMLSTSAFNALLKTIEEPPPYVVFIFATTELHKVPATIKSRCQQFNFRLLDIQTLHDALAAAAQEQGIEADDEALFWIAREGTGSVRDSYTLFDQVAAFSDGHITLEKIQDKLGLTSIELINELVTACVRKNANEALNILHDCLSSGVSVEQCTIDCAKYFRSLLLVKHGITKESILGQSAARFSPEVLQSWSSTHIERALAIMLQVFKDINYSVNPTYELELAVSRLAWLSDFVPPDELKRSYEKIRALFEGRSVEIHRAEPSNEQSAITADRSTAFAKNAHADTTSDERSKAAQASSPNTSGSAFTRSKSSAGALVSNNEQNERAETMISPSAAVQSVNESAVSPMTAADPMPCQTAETEQRGTQSVVPHAIRFQSLDELKNILVQEFSSVSGLLSAALHESFAWEKSQHVLTIQTEKAFNKVTIDKNRKALLESLKKYFPDEAIEVKVSVVQEQSMQTAAANNEPPEKIKNLMRVFQARLLDERELEQSADSEN